MSRSFGVRKTTTTISIIAPFDTMTGSNRKMRLATGGADEGAGMGLAAPRCKAGLPGQRVTRPA